MHQDSRPYSKIPPIAHVEALASILSIQKNELIEISSSVEDLWKPGKLLYKKNGEPRPTIDAKEPLKSIHEKIKNRLLKKVFYPKYLLGGIADSMSPRDYARHAKIHSNKTILISEDIANFFPSTSYQTVLSIWKYFFGFTNEVADFLTKLTTLNGSLPQGWKTSGYLANLVFWDKEPELVLEFKKRGYAYSRFMDDVTVSCRFRLTNKHKTFIISRTYRMLRSKGYSPKRPKHEISSNERRMEVTGLNVNSSNPSLSKEKRAAIRSAVHRCEMHYTNDKTSATYKRIWNSTSGKVGTYKRFHPKPGKNLRKRLTEVKPK